MYEHIEKVYRERLLSIKPILRDNDIQLEYIFNYLSKDKNTKILDAGCGNGNYAFYLADLGYINISAVDLFANIETDKFKYQKSSIDNLPFEDNSFDFIYSNSVIYYLENPKYGIYEFKRVLKKDGILFFTAHTKYSFFTLWRIIKRDIFKLKSMEHLKGVKFYSANYYKKILEESGFEILLQDGYETSFFTYPLYKKIVRGFEKYLNIKLPLRKSYSNNGLLGKVKSELSYHSVFVARKIVD
ncbi:MAG: class I SAM-dependent methyltransferase [Sulfurovaceae bacterium]|nr:class I SAM-dependent methyltransferase [Sulfurovaceae bacterium]